VIVDVFRCKYCGGFLAGIEVLEFSEGTYLLANVHMKCPNKRCRKEQVEPVEWVDGPALTKVGRKCTLKSKKQTV
jgi:hypothetical protein